MYREIGFIERTRTDSLGRNGRVHTNGLAMARLDLGGGRGEVHLRPITGRGLPGQARLTLAVEAAGEVAAFLAQAFARGASGRARGALVARLRLVCAGAPDPGRLRERDPGVPLPRPEILGFEGAMPGPRPRRIEFAARTVYDSLGRNGFMHTRGCLLFHLDHQDRAAEVVLAPVTGQGAMGRAGLSVHAEAAGEAAAFLAEAHCREVDHRARLALFDRMEAICSGFGDPGARDDVAVEEEAPAFGPR